MKGIDKCQECCWKCKRDEPNSPDCFGTKFSNFPCGAEASFSQYFGSKNTQRNNSIELANFYLRHYLLKKASTAVQRFLELFQVAVVFVLKFIVRRIIFRKWKGRKHRPSYPN